MSPVDKMKQYADTHISSDSRSPSTAVTPHIMSTTNSITPMSIQAREKFTPVGTKYQSKTKRVERLTSFFESIILFRSNHNSISDKSNMIDHHPSLSFREKSNNRPNPTISQTQHQTLLDSHSPPHDRKSVYTQIFSR